MCDHHSRTRMHRNAHMHEYVQTYTGPHVHTFSHFLPNLPHILTLFMMRDAFCLLGDSFQNNGRPSEEKGEGLERERGESVEQKHGAIKSQLFSLKTADDDDDYVEGFCKGMLWSFK